RALRDRERPHRQFRRQRGRLPHQGPRIQPPAEVGARLLSRGESLARLLDPAAAHLHPGSSAPRPGAIPAPSRSPTAAQLTTRTTELARGGKGAVCPQVEVTLSTTAHPPIERLGRGFPLVLAPPRAKFRFKQASAAAFF